MHTLREWMLRFWRTSDRPQARRRPRRRIADRIWNWPQKRPDAATLIRCRSYAQRRSRSGGDVHAIEALRDQRGVPWLDDLTRDVRHGLRTLRRSPVFTPVALLTLALGIGANTAIFTIVHGVILRPLAYPTPSN